LNILLSECEIKLKFLVKYLEHRGIKLLASVDISTRAPWITQNEQHFVAGEIPHELDAQMEGH
jgi:hypothetical protein